MARAKGMNYCFKNIKSFTFGNVDLYDSDIMGFNGEGIIIDSGSTFTHFYTPYFDKVH